MPTKKSAPNKSDTMTARVIPVNAFIGRAMEILEFALNRLQAAGDSACENTSLAIIGPLDGRYTVDVFVSEAADAARVRLLDANMESCVELTVAEDSTVRITAKWPLDSDEG